ncbi:MAG: hypothetical protein SRB2_01921 [Desulfobacteraceae bacterium Eth-SRB2]|nr:MAG: hypothetical protein SRB2_01921 [Desulfobacteraceae bacterium Eth-SRB2]
MHCLSGLGKSTVGMRGLAETLVMVGLGTLHKPKGCIMETLHLKLSAYFYQPNSHALFCKAICSDSCISHQGIFEDSIGEDLAGVERQSKPSQSSCHEVYHLMAKE